MVLV
jgi:hypothetical protein